MKDLYIQRGSTWFLRGAIAVIGIVAVLICIFGIPDFSRGALIEFPSAAWLYYPLLVGTYLAAALFFGVLYQALVLLRYIDKNKAFSQESVNALKRIKRLAACMSFALYLSLLPLSFYAAQGDDAPGFVLIGGFMTSIPLIVAVFAAVLQRLLQSAVDMQAERDLTA